jgi:two-component system NtrC family response regulator
LDSAVRRHEPATVPRGRGGSGSLAAGVAAWLWLAVPPALAAEEGAPPKESVLTARILTRPPTLDGVLEPEEWPEDPGSTARLDSAEQALPRPDPRWRGPADASAVVRVAADAEALYLGVTVADDVPFHPGESWWQGDGLELFLNTDLSDDRGEGAENRYSDDDWQIFLMPRNPLLRWGVSYHGEAPRFDDAGLVGVRIAWRAGEGGSYAFEARLPLANFPGLSGTGASEIGFALALNDVDRVVPPDAPGGAPLFDPGTYLSWNSGFLLYQRPRHFGVLRIPERPSAPATAEPARPDEGASALWLAGVLAAALVAFFVGPGSRRLARAGPRPKLALLALDGLLAFGIAYGASRAERRAEADALERLEPALADADLVAREAAELGALDPTDPAARSRTLGRLLSGERVPATPPVADQAYVALEPAREPLAYRLALGASSKWPLDAPVPATALRVGLSPRRTPGDDRPEPAAASRLGVFLVRTTEGDEDLPLVANLSGPSADRHVTLRLAPRATPAEVVRIEFRGSEGAAAAFLTSLATVGPDGVETPVALPLLTEDGIPVLAGPDGAFPFLGLVLVPNGERDVALPTLPGADRLWMVLTAERAFPVTRHGEPVAEVSISFDAGPPLVVSVINGDDVDEERLVYAVKHPADMRSRVAYRWTDARGEVHHHDLFPVALPPGRVATSMRVRNLGGAGNLKIPAATLTRGVADTGAGLLALEADASGLRDAVFVRDPARFRPFVEPRDAHVVRGEREVGPSHRPTRLLLTAPLPEDLRGLSARRETALLTCLVLGAFLVVLLAVDAFEAFRRIGLRLVAGVLVAALLPVAVTIVLADRGNATRLEAERARSVRGWLAASRTALTAEARRAQLAAQGLLEVAASGRGRDDPASLRSAVSVYRKSAISGGAAAAVVLRGRNLPTLTVEPEVGTARLDGPAFLAERADPPGLYASPWDGLLLVGTARSTSGDDWRKVTYGLRVDDAFVAERVAAALPEPDEAEVVVLTRDGEVAGHSGGDAAGLGAALSARFEDVRRAPGGGRTGVVSRIRTPAGSRLAVVAPLGSAEARDVPAAWLAVGVDRGSLDAALAALRQELVGLGLAAAVLVACVAALLARRIADPVRDLVLATDAVRRGEFDAPAPPPGTDEVGDLGVAFDQMRRELKNRVGDLAFLRAAQESVASTLDLGRACEAGLARFRERFAPDLSLLLTTASSTGPLVVRAEHGRRHASADRPVPIAEGGWARAALSSTEPVVVSHAASDSRVAAEGAALSRLLEEKGAWIATPLWSGAEVQGLVVLAWDGEASLPRPEARALLTPLAGIVALAVQNARLYRLAALDEATGLPGATAFESALRSDVDAALAGGRAAVVLRFGIDGLDRVAARRGVETARSLLRSVADALRAEAAGRAHAGRLREDELAARLPGATREEARAFAEAARARMAACEVRADDGGEAVRAQVSVGIARCPDDATSLEFLLGAAERALVAARRDGGGRVEDVRRVEAGLVEAPPFEDGAVFRTERMVRVVETARRIARTDGTVLLTGETGTGKEVVADLIHRHSRRAGKPFVKVNVAAFPETLLESELFGHERGAFTGADRRREGRFELAHGGTLFLDEVGEMTPQAQAKLLRVLAEGRVTRLGGTRPIDVDVRVVAATNQRLEEAVAAGRFREDLFYRLNVLRIELPPLRERREEIPSLVERFLADARSRFGRGPRSLSPQAMDVLYRHSWPGNVRELKNVVDRLAVHAEGEVATPADLRIDPSRAGSAAPAAAPLDGLNDRQRRLLEHLAAHGRCTNRRFHEMTGASPRTGLRDLQDLIDRGLVVREGKRRGAVYRLP